LPIPRKRLRRLLAAVVEGENLPPAYREAEVSLLFCEDDLIQQLNRDYRGKDRPTDVLSFPQHGENGLLGDVIISVPAAERQARERNQSLALEVEWLFMHGVLHLLGYEDETDEEADEMDRRARLARERAAAADAA